VNTWFASDRVTALVRLNVLKIEAGKFVTVIDGEYGPTCLARTRC